MRRMNQVTQNDTKNEESNAENDKDLEVHEIDEADNESCETNSMEDEKNRCKEIFKSTKTENDN